MICHRLDQLTSGVLVLCRTREAQVEMNKKFQRRQVKKKYWAVVDGIPRTSRGSVSLPLSRDNDRRPLQQICHATGKHAVTLWKVLVAREEDDAALVELDLLTGRSHQLRVHLSAIGHPILGDDFYAPPLALARAERLLLHARELHFDHPITREPLSFEAPCDFLEPFLNGAFGQNIECKKGEEHEEKKEWREDTANGYEKDRPKLPIYPPAQDPRRQVLRVTQSRTVTRIDTHRLALEARKDSRGHWRLPAQDPRLSPAVAECAEASAVPPSLRGNGASKDTRSNALRTDFAYQFIDGFRVEPSWIFVGYAWRDPKTGAVIPERKYDVRQRFFLEQLEVIAPACLRLAVVASSAAALLGVAGILDSTTVTLNAMYFFSLALTSLPSLGIAAHRKSGKQEWAGLEAADGFGRFSLLWRERVSVLAFCAVDIFGTLCVEEWNGPGNVRIIFRGVTVLWPKLFLLTLAFSDLHFWFLTASSNVCWVFSLIRTRVIHTEEETVVAGLLMVNISLVVAFLRSLIYVTLGKFLEAQVMRDRAELGRKNNLSYLMHEMRNPLSGSMLMLVEFRGSLEGLLSLSRKAERRERRRKKLEAGVSFSPADARVKEFPEAASPVSLPLERDRLSGSYAHKEAPRDINKARLSPDTTRRSEEANGEKTEEKAEVDSPSCASDGRKAVFLPLKGRAAQHEKTPEEQQSVVVRQKQQKEKAQPETGTAVIESPSRRRSISFSPNARDQACAFYVNVKEESTKLLEFVNMLSSQFDKMKGVCDDVLQLEKLDKGGFEFIFTSNDVKRWIENAASQARTLFPSGGGAIQRRPSFGGRRRSSGGLVSASPHANGGPTFELLWEQEDGVAEVLEETGGSCIALADWQRLEQVISNLISNAKKFTKHGSVTMKASLRLPTPSERAAFNRILLLHNQQPDAAHNESPVRLDSNPPMSADSDKHKEETSGAHPPLLTVLKRRVTNLLAPEKAPVESSNESEVSLSQWVAAVKELKELEDATSPPAVRPAAAVTARTSFLQKRKRASQEVLGVQPFFVLTVSVLDTGAGLDEEDTARLFKPYGQVRAGELQNGGGTGLGLCICKSFVEAHGGGRIGVSSAGREKGSEFFFEVFLPMVQVSKAECETPATRARVLRRNSKAAPLMSPTAQNDSSASSALSADEFVERFPPKQQQQQQQGHEKGGQGGTLTSDSASDAEAARERRRELRRVATPRRRRLEIIAASLTPIRTPAPTFPPRERSGSDLLSSALGSPTSLPASPPACKQGGIEASLPSPPSNQKEASTFDERLISSSGASPEASKQEEETKSTSAQTPSVAAQAIAGNTPSTAPCFSYAADILLVDDDRFCLVCGEAAIRRLGYSVQICENGQRAVELLVEERKAFRLILMDNNMPIMEGPEAVSRIMTHFKGEQEKEESVLQPMPLILGLTGETSEATATKFLNAGALKVLHKPLTAQRLEEALRGAEGGNADQQIGNNPEIGELFNELGLGDELEVRPEERQRERGRWKAPQPVRILAGRPAEDGEEEYRVSFDDGTFVWMKESEVDVPELVSAYERVKEKIFWQVQ
uniref:histidine kinase n=1 Tax=Chromera velia CCMP2878 TaxID=1169474 RepID=A0A0K6S6N5_9ALVE|eukprot:Cvel_16784.t1-p1 / transcript=Cvel_16784.t1 / gene=Cvel_16784 / organism=Chromera_velia_CCMP2878 / gene_product=Ribosomal large subunit pseudouridine synthase A, putative / transcript_product=Ribosomal large subunit pseudouridine synthase A, putative / location=Cvel_scaffold1310:730-17373(+) / protein_length=1561 / sequence_SO=supercontig / SO=protein_coding / is_pseudo=false